MTLVSLISELKNIIDLLDKENFDYPCEEDKNLKKYIVQLQALNEIDKQQIGSEKATIRALVAHIKRFIKRIPNHYEQDTVLGFLRYLVGVKYNGKLYEYIVAWLAKVYKDKDYKEAVNISRIIASTADSGDSLLDLSYLNITFENISQISKLTQLKKLNLSTIKVNGKYINELDDAEYNNFLQMLSKLQKLTHLNLSANLIGQLSADRLTQLGECLSDLPSLTDLDLSYNNIKDERPGIIDLFNEKGDIIFLPPTATAINSMDLHSNTGYIRILNKLFYVNKSILNNVIEVPFVGDNIDVEVRKFDENIKSIPTARRLTSAESNYISDYIKKKTNLNLHLDPNLKSNLLFENFPSLKKLNLSGNLLCFNKINEVDADVTATGYSDQKALLEQFAKRKISVDLTYNYISFLDEKTLLEREAPIFIKYPLLDPSRNPVSSGIESVLKPSLFITKEQGVVVVANEENHAQLLVQKLDDHFQLSLLKYHLVGGERKSLPPFVPGLEYKYIPPIDKPEDESLGLYRAVAATTHNGDYSALRQMVIWHIKNKKLNGIAFPNAGQILKQYYQRILQHNTQFADHKIELEVIMHVLRRPVVIFDILGNISSDSINNLNKFKGEPIFVFSKAAVKDQVGFIQYLSYTAPDGEGRDLISQATKKYLLNCKPCVWTKESLHGDGKILIKKKKRFIHYYVGETQDKIFINSIPEMKDLSNEQELMALLPKLATIISENNVPLIPIRLPVTKKKIDGSVTTEVEHANRFCCSNDAKVSIKQLDVTEKYNFFSSNRSLCTYSDFSMVDNSRINEMHKMVRHYAMHGLTEKLYEYLPTCDEKLINCYRFCIKLCQFVGITIPEPLFLVPAWGLRQHVDQTPLHLSFASFFGNGRNNQANIGTTNDTRQVLGGKI